MDVRIINQPVAKVELKFVHHKDLTVEKWAQFSLAEQLGNVGSEVNRMLNWRTRDIKIAQNAFERALELIDLTLSTVKGKYRIREIARSRELLVSSWLKNDASTASDLDYLNRYFLQFALLAQQ